MTAGLGLSASAIAGWGTHHPYDPADLLRCINYCHAIGLTTTELRTRMAGRSAAWDALLPHWDDLVALLRHEMATRDDGNAPRTYVEMRRVIAGGTACDACGATGRGADCPKCNGTGRRCGGRCRATRCYRGADHCPTCRGHGFTISDGDGS